MDMNTNENGEDYLLTLFETCEILGKSSRTVTRYVHRHMLHPRGIKSRQGTLEYRFSKSEVEAMRLRQNELGQFNNYIGQNQMPRSQAASFANLTYPPAVRQSVSFAIPGVSFPIVENPSGAMRPADVASQIKPEKIQETVVEKRPEPEIVKKNKTEETFKLPPVESPAARNRNDDDEGIITILKETTGMLRDQLRVKDDQIKNLDDKIGQLIERNRETNILLKGLQDKMVLLEKPKAKNVDRVERADRSQVSQPVQENINNVTQDEPQRPVPMPKDTRVSEPVRINVYGGKLSDAPSDTIAKVDSEEAMPDDYYSQRQSDEPEKKGLFGKLFR